MAQMIGLARLGRDAEIRYTQNGDAVAGLSLAFNYGRKGEDGKRPTQWVDGSLWGKLAEALSPYLLKGGQVYVVLDDIHIETYQTKDGGQGTKLAGRVLSIELASSAGQGQQQAQGAAPQQRPAQSPPPARQPQPQAQRPAQQRDPFDDFDSEIPF